MKNCDKCGKKIKIPNVAYLNLETYKVGGSVLIASECCKKGYYLKMNVSYSITPYEGSLGEDDWGTELNK